MKIDYEKMKVAFPCKAWCYAEQFDGVKIGKWDGVRFIFFQPLEEAYLLELRVFDAQRELKFTGDKLRDTANYQESDFIEQLPTAHYFMYGEQAEIQGEYTQLSETRGGVLMFPQKLEFPQADTQLTDVIGLKLGIRNFVRYNPVSVLPKDMDYDFGLSASGAGALEVVDYAYTGFFYTNGTAVEL